METQGIQNISMLQMAICYILFLFVFLLIWYYRLNLTKDALFSTLRMSVQLALAGLVLKYIFQFNFWYSVLIILLVMLGFAVHTILSRVKLKFRRTIVNLFVSLLIGCCGTMLFFGGLVVRYEPWYDARYLIPLLGMIIGNSMNGCVLALDRYYGSMRDNRDRVESILAFGGTPFEASRHIYVQAFKAAILPTLSSMTGMGVVFLPGMMTGQILSGAEPFLAVKYQIAIMMAILSATVFSSFILLKLETKLVFTKRAQLVDI